MKALLTLALAAASFSSAFAAQDPAECATLAPASSFAYKTYATADRLKLVVVKDDQEPVEVRIRDAAHQTIFKTQIREAGALLPVNIQALEPGTYTVEYRRGCQAATDSFVK